MTTDSQREPEPSGILHPSDVLLADANLAVSKAKNDADRRSAIRAIFASVEELVWATKRSLLTPPANLFLEGEVAFLREVAYRIDGRGKVRTKPRHIPLRTNVRFTLRMAEKKHPEFKSDLARPGWEEMVRSIQLRNRLTHPKALSDVAVSDEEWSDAIVAYGWFQLIVIKIMILDLDKLNPLLPPEVLEGMEERAWWASEEYRVRRDRFRKALGLDGASQEKR